MREGKARGMEIKVLDEGRPYIVAIEGRLDKFASSQLKEFADQLFAKAVNDIVVDMDECDLVTSAGLRVIVTMQKRVQEGGSLVFRNVQPDVMEVFEITGFVKILTFE